MRKHVTDYLIRTSAPWLLAVAVVRGKQLYVEMVRFCGAYLVWKNKNC